MVLVIVGLVAAIVVGALNLSRAKGRDAQRLSDIKQLQNALELYYTDNKTYPANANAWLESTAGGWPTLLSSTYIKKVPTDPINSSGVSSGTSGYTYAYMSVCKGEGYLLLARLEQGNAATYQNKSLKTCAVDTTVPTPANLQDTANKRFIQGRTP